MQNYRLFIFFYLIIFFPFFGFSQITSYSEELKQVVDAIKKVVMEKNANDDCTPAIIAIGGCPGVGKSTIAAILQTELAKRQVFSIIISQDHYGLSQELRKQFSNPLDPKRIQWSKLHKTLFDIKNGKEKIIKPIIDQRTKAMGEETLVLNHIDCVFLEGAYVLNSFAPMNYRNYADLAIYLETSLENIYDWKWERELKKPIPRMEKAFLDHMKAIMSDFIFHVYPSRKHADYVVQIDYSHRYSVYNNIIIKEIASPDFTTIRLESLSY